MSFCFLFFGTVFIVNSTRTFFSQRENKEKVKHGIIYMQEEILSFSLPHLKKTPFMIQT